ncbi:MAG: hypothetical protein DMF06_01820 [Verrucomicrobia bacterium]|nr:MAG: hypothetical protein DMF06_01820 [Verrucomicrobiota bacterium]
MIAQTETSSAIPASSDEKRQWWLFCLLIGLLKVVLLVLDPLPKMFIGDSACYISTALVGWIPDDRSYFYGFVIRWVSLATGSLTSLLLLQCVIGAATAILLAHICRSTFGLSARVSYVLGFICALDPLQLVWERYVMTETISLFLYVAVLHYAFRYLKGRRLRDLAFVQGLAILVLGFRMSYLLLVQISAVFLPIVAFAPLLWTAWRNRRDPQPERWRSLKVAFGHGLASIALMFLLHGGYRQLNGLLCGREPAYLYATGLHLLAFWAPVVTPADATDPRLAEIIGQGEEFEIKDLTARNRQRFDPDYLVDRWQQAEPDISDASQIAKETALRALRRAPLQVLGLAAQTFAQYWNLKDLRSYASIDLGHHDLTSEQRDVLSEYFHFATDGWIVGAPPTLLQHFFLNCWPYCYFVLLSPLLGLWAVYVARDKQIALLLLLHLSIILGVTFTFTVAPSLRYLQPASLLTLLTVALCLRAYLDGRSLKEVAISQR